MKKGLLFLVALVILIIAGLSIYINSIRHPVEVRIVHLLNNQTEITASINGNEIPYTINYGAGSEYLPLEKKMLFIDLVVKIDDQSGMNFDNIQLAPDSLNTLLLCSNGSQPSIYRIETPFTTVRNYSALRYFKNPGLEDQVEIQLFNDEEILFPLLGEGPVSSYVNLSEGTYRINLKTAMKELDYRLFLEKGEYYTLIILPDVEDDDTKNNRRTEIWLHK